MVHAGSLEILRDDASRLGEAPRQRAMPVRSKIYDDMQHLFQVLWTAGRRISLNRLGNSSARVHRRWNTWRKPKTVGERVSRNGFSPGAL